MTFGTFTLVIDGERLDGTPENKARLHLTAQGAGTLRDDAGDEFKFPAQFAKSDGVSISLPYELTLFTDSTSGNSTTIGYEGYVRTDYGRVPFIFAAPQAGATVQLVDLTDDVVTPISDLQQFRDEAEAAAAAADASETAAAASAVSVAALTIDPDAYGAVGNAVADDTVALQAAIDAASVAVVNKGGIRCLVALRPGKRYIVSGLTFPSFTGLTGGGALWHKAGSTTHLIQVADPATTTNVTIENVNLNGQAGSQTTVVDGIRLDNATAATSHNAYHKVRNVHVYATKGIGCYLGPRTRGSSVEGLTTYMTDAQGLVLEGADSRVLNCDIGQAGVDGVLLSGSGYIVTGIKSWYSGRLDGVGHGFLISGSGMQLSNCWSQDSMGNGFKVFRSGTNVSVALDNCVSDNDNAANNGSVGFSFFRLVNSVVRGQVRTFTGGRNGIPVNGAALSGGCSANDIRLSVLGQSSWAVGTSADNADNHIEVNGREGRLLTQTYAASITPNPWTQETVKVTLTGNLTIANPGVTPPGIRLRLILQQDATGGRTITFGSAFKKTWTPALTASKADIITFQSDGTNWLQIGAETGI